LFGLWMSLLVRGGGVGGGLACGRSDDVFFVLEN
jgi:hypothetical protein